MPKGDTVGNIVIDGKGDKHEAKRKRVADLERQSSVVEGPLDLKIWPRTRSFCK